MVIIYAFIVCAVINFIVAFVGGIYIRKFDRDIDEIVKKWHEDDRSA